jgi:hypothetical protein
MRPKDFPELFVIRDESSANRSQVSQTENPPEGKLSGHKIGTFRAIAEKSVDAKKLHALKHVWGL